ncbi:GDP-fucose protein O-fucosyltransferase [Rhizoctonia solani]|uniref:GDP-fucose protein O-fucosyltransferase n=1 Tax=Rhizoctonia solani TaxID=456999 RepID=A0A8H7H6L9_9AGAM|nr:GDP-fucose protein O-fucosyltransferase [Rhizoctonia solani]
MPSRDGSDVHSPLLLPTHVNERHSPRPLKSHAPRTRRWLQFYGTAIITGIAFHLVLVGLGSTEVVRQRVPASVGDWLPGGPKSSEGKTSVIHGKPDCAPPAKAIPPPKTQAQKIAEEEAPWTMDQIRQMVGRTKGYYARDYSLGLGWNNVRYIFEASLLHAQLLNRTLVLPSFIYARACEWDILYFLTVSQVCASFAPMVNRGDAIGWGEWRNLPIEKQMGWRIPIGVMLDMNHLRKAHPVVTVAEYLQLNGMSPSIEWSNGAWHREMYQNDGKISIHEIPNNEYDPKPTVRVEMLPSHPPGNEDNPFSETLLVALGDRTVMDLEEAAKALKDRVVISGDDQLEAFLREHGWEVLHTYRGALGMDYTKSVVEPIKQVAPRSRLRGMFDDYNHINEEVLILAGETHLNRKPGGLRFVHPEQQAHFASTVLHDMRPTGPVRRLAMKLHERMQKIVGGRQWMGAHMRRGDFVDQGWVMEHSIEGHLSRITQRLSNGRKILQEIYDTKQIQIYEVPNVEPERDIFDRPPPLESDSFYLATDERSRDGLGYIRSNGGVLIEDLLTLEDRQEFGWPIMITDVLAIIEQTVLSHSAYFYAHAMSSVGGGVVNMRASRGADKRTALID